MDNTITNNQETPAETFVDAPIAQHTPAGTAQMPQASQAAQPQPMPAQQIPAQQVPQYQQIPVQQAQVAQPIQPMQMPAKQIPQYCPPQQSPQTPAQQTSAAQASSALYKTPGSTAMLTISIVVLAALGLFTLAIPALTSLAKDGMDLLAIVAAAAFYLCGGAVIWYPLVIAQGISGILSVRKESSIDVPKVSVILGIISLVFSISGVALLAMMFGTHTGSSAFMSATLATSAVLLIIPNLIYIPIAVKYLNARKRQMKQA